MERRSDKHGRLTDEALEQETRSMVRGSPVEARADESREKEGPGEGEPTPDSLVSSPASDHDDIERRSELARFLRPSAFPGRPVELLAVARDEGAPEWVVDAVGGLPERQFANPAEVWEELTGRPLEPRHS